MILYHGSYTEIPSPDVLHSRKNVDFGQGFYTTTLFEQAQKWCGKYKKAGKKGIVSEYELNEKLLNKYKVLKFDTYSEEWLDFIISCRSGNDKGDADIVIGGVANDKVFNTVELFLNGLIDKTESLKRLKYEKPNLQIAFRSQTVLDECLKFTGSKEV